MTTRSSTREYYGKDTFVDKDGTRWIQAAEASLCREAAKWAEGDTLEVGLGVGYTHRALHNNPKVDRVVTLEMNPQVVEHYGCPTGGGCQVLVTKWEDFKGMEGFTPHTVLFDAHNSKVDLKDIEPLLSRWVSRLIVYQYDGQRGWFDVLEVEKGEAVRLLARVEDPNRGRSPGYGGA